MNEEQLLSDYLDGRRDFAGESLHRRNLFTASLARTHPELIDADFGALTAANSAVLQKPLRGPDLRGIGMREAVLVGSDFRRSLLIDGDFRRADGKFANFTRAKLQRASFIGADLRGARFDHCDLSGLDFTGALLDHASFQHAILDRTRFDKTSLIGVNFSWAKLSNFSICGLDLTGASLEGARLQQISFERSILRKTIFIGAKLNKTLLHNCDITRSHLSSVVLDCCNIESSNLSRALIENCEFIDSHLNSGNFHGSKIIDTYFNGCSLYNPSFTSSHLERLVIDNTSLIEPNLDHTCFTRTNLSLFVESSPRHTGQCSIDYFSVAMVIEENPTHPLDIDPYPDLRVFMEKCGMPVIAITFMIDSIRSLDPNKLRSLMRSTFISYGGPDEGFARQLNNDLGKNGVTTFFFPQTAEFGEKLHATMRRVDQYDRTILICSAQSLPRQGVQNEIEKVLEREAREGGTSLLIPITIDDYLFNDWKPKRPALKQEILSRVVADFSDPAIYDAQLHRLFLALRKADGE